MDKDCLCTNKGAGIVPGPNLPKPCQNEPEKIRLTTEYLPPSLGTDAEGQPFAPKQGVYYSTVVTYGANNAVYIYDARGIYTKLNPTQQPLTFNIGDDTVVYDGQTPVTLDLSTGGGGGTTVKILDEFDGEPASNAVYDAAYTNSFTEQINGQLEVINGELVNLNSEISNTDSTVSVLNNNLQTITTEVDNINSEITTINEKLEGASGVALGQYNIQFEPFKIIVFDENYAPYMLSAINNSVIQKDATITYPTQIRKTFFIIFEKPYTYNSENVDAWGSVFIAAVNGQPFANTLNHTQFLAYKNVEVTTDFAPTSMLPNTSLLYGELDINPLYQVGELSEIKTGTLFGVMGLINYQPLPADKTFKLGFKIGYTSASTLLNLDDFINTLSFSTIVASLIS